MEDRATKLARLGRLRRKLPHMSQSALTAVLREAQREPLPRVSRRDDLRFVRNAIADQSTPYGTVHTKVPLARSDGSIWWLECQCILAMLYATAKWSMGFSRLITSTLARCGPSTPHNPWKLAIYCDEVDPGDPLSSTHGRKFQAVYWSLTTFGLCVLWHEECWFTACTARTDEVKRVVGGMSAVIVAILTNAFLGTHDPMVAGVVLDLANGTQVRIFIEFDMFVADEKAVQEVNCTRGANAENPCFCCMNLKNKRSVALPYARLNIFVDSTELDITKLRFHTDETIFHVFDELQRKSAIETPAEFTLTQKTAGFTYVPGSMMQNQRIRHIYEPISCTIWDWMHCVFVDGIFSITFGLLMMSFKPHGVTYATLHAFLQQWTWPARINSRSVAGKDSCSPANAKKWYGKDRKFKPPASEQVSLYQVFAYFFVVECRVPRVCQAGVTCFLLLCDVIDALLGIARNVITPDYLMCVISRFLEAFKAVFGPAHMTSKFHWILHLPWQLLKHGILVACFVHERKHRLLKRYAADKRNTSHDFERGLLAELTDHHLTMLEDSELCFDPKLINAYVRPPKAALATLREAYGPTASIEIASSARINHLCTAHRGDVVLMVVGGVKAVGRLFLFASVDNVLVVGVSLWSLIDVGQNSARWSATAPRESILEADCILDTVIWSQTDDVVTVIMPPYE